jgi:hypothetical protein
MREEYGQLFVSNGNDETRLIATNYGDEVEKLLTQIPSGAEIVSINHTQAGNYGQYWSTLIIWRVYLDD